MIKNWHLLPGYLEFLEESLRKALADVRARVGGDAAPDAVEVIFTAHSLPTRILAQGDPYPQQLRETAEAVAARMQLPRWSIGWQSAGRTDDPWIGPDLLDVLAERAAQGVRGVVVCPAGFVSEHLEILYDLDIEATQRAAELDIAFARTAMPHNDPRVFASLAELIRRQAT